MNSHNQSTTNQPAPNGETGLTTTPTTQLPLVDFYSGVSDIKSDQDIQVLADELKQVTNAPGLMQLFLANHIFDIVEKLKDYIEQQIKDLEQEEKELTGVENLEKKAILLNKIQVLRKVKKKW